MQSTYVVQMTGPHGFHVVYVTAVNPLTAERAARAAYPDDAVIGTPGRWRG